MFSCFTGICRFFRHSPSSLPILQLPICAIPLGTWVPKIGEPNRRPLAMLRPSASLSAALNLLIQGIQIYSKLEYSLELSHLSFISIPFVLLTACLALYSRLSVVTHFFTPCEIIFINLMCEYFKSKESFESNLLFLILAPKHFQLVVCEGILLWYSVCLENWFCRMKKKKLTGIQLWVHWSDHAAEGSFL